MSKEGKESLPFFVEKRKEFMVKTIELRKPILINGVEIKQLTYDFDEISCEAYTKAFGASMSVALVSAQNGKPNANIMEQDGNLHLYLGMEAIIAINPDIDVADLDVAARLATNLRTAVLVVELLATDTLYFFLFFQLGQTLFFLDGTLLHAIVHFLHMDVLYTEAGCEEGDFHFLPQ